MILLPEQAQDLHDRALAAIDARDDAWPLGWGGRDARRDADRERLASDLAGLRLHADPSAPSCIYGPRTCPDARRYSDGLRRTAALYGVT